RDDDPSLANPGHGELEALSDFAQDVFVRDADVVEGYLRRPPRAHCLDGIAPPSHRAVDQEGSDAALVTLGLVRDRKDDREVRLETVGDEDLPAVEHPARAVPDGRLL